MTDTLGPRPITPGGSAASLAAMQAGEKLVHRPEKKVVPAERIDRSAQTGPRPAFRHTYLQQLAAFWPQEPDPPVTHVDYDADAAQPDRRAGAPVESHEEGLAALRTDGDATQPAVDIRL